MRGFVQVYTGDGKGKTTAALGLALRAAGAGLKVFIGQFIKMGDYSEIKALERFPDLIRVEQFGLGRFVAASHRLQTSRCQVRLARTREAIASGEYQMVILEEANVAVKYGLFPVQELLRLIIDKPMDMELVITGRGASPRIIEAADLVTEMKEVKHYYEKGVRARVGIEK